MARLFTYTVKGVGGFILMPRCACSFSCLYNSLPMPPFRSMSKKTLIDRNPYKSSLISSRLFMTTLQPTLLCNGHFKCIESEPRVATSTTLTCFKNSYHCDAYDDDKAVPKLDRMEQEPGKRNTDTELLQTIKETICLEIIPQICKDSNYSRPLRDEASSSYARNMTSKDALVILISVSGGCDSMALFHSIMMLLSNDRQQMDAHDITLQLDCSQCGQIYGQDENIDNNLPCAVHVVHFDHQQRGSESDGDRQLVQKLCKDHNIPFHCFTWKDEPNDVGKEEEIGQDDKTKTEPATTNTLRKKFSQESAREWRRSTSVKLLTKIINEIEQTDQNIHPRHHGIIMTAHHKDDSEETVLLKLLRGVHITNLSGMDSIQEVQHFYRETDADGSVKSGKDHNLYFAKPLLGARKSELKQFMLSRGLEWREDASNTSNKYMRNRVRNELMPLLKDLVKGEDILERRLGNLEEQSKKVNKELLQRSRTLIDKLRNDKSGSGGHSPQLFPLPRLTDTLSLVEEQAIHDWVEERSCGQVSLSYDKLMGICEQIVTYPERRQWKIAIGSGWDIIRNGDVLEVLRNGSDRKGATLSNNPDSWILESTTLEENGNGVPTLSKDWIYEIIDVEIRNEIDKSAHFVLRSVDGNSGMRFLPPWRRGGSPMKVKEFLRGQKIPLHLRDCAQILCLSDGYSTSESIVAVWVENSQPNRGDGSSSGDEVNKGRWVVDASFSVDYDSPYQKERIVVKKRTGVGDIK